MGQLNEPRSPEHAEDQRAVYDALVATCPVIHEHGRWAVLGHAEAAAVATDPVTFSSRVTTRRAIPNTLDGAEHAAYRALIDPYLTDEAVAAQEPQCRKHASAIIDDLPRGLTVKTIAHIGIPYAVRAQSTWLGWPASLEPDLVAWIRDNQDATRSGDRTRTATVAQRFDRILRGLLDARRTTPTDDVTSQLLAETIDGRPLTDLEIISIVRNWTAGDLGSLAASIGVLTHFLATHPHIQAQLRDDTAHDRHATIEAAIEEILRIDDPFVSNRRIATRDTTVGGADIAAGDQIVVNWMAANRDPRVFDDPDRYDPVGHAHANLVFGTGPHACPGRALTLMELRVILEELLARTHRFELATDRPTVRETLPVSGWARVPIVLH